MLQITITLVELVITSMMMTVFLFGEKTLSTLNPDDNDCRKDLVPITKKSTNESVCVKASSAPKLIERGWVIY